MRHALNRRRRGNRAWAGRTAARGHRQPSGGGLLRKSRIHLRRSSAHAVRSGVADTPIRPRVSRRVPPTSRCPCPPALAGRSLARCCRLPTPAPPPRAGTGSCHPSASAPRGAPAAATGGPPPRTAAEPSYDQPHLSGSTSPATFAVKALAGHAERGDVLVLGSRTAAAERLERANKREPRPASSGLRATSLRRTCSACPPGSSWSGRVHGRGGAVAIGLGRR